MPAAQEQLMQVLQPVRARQRYQGRTHLHCLFWCLGQARPMSSHGVSRIGSPYAQVPGRL